MNEVILKPHQIQAMNAVKGFTNVAFYLDCGLGKTFVGSEKLIDFNNTINLVVCQKSKVKDWLNHFKEHYNNYYVWDLTKKSDFECFLEPHGIKEVGVINYDLLYRRNELLKLKDFTLMLDESSLIQNEATKRAKFVLKMKPKNTILLSGTPVSGGKYEKLWSQCKLLGWDITKKSYWDKYVNFNYQTFNGSLFYPIKVVIGYKNVEDLKLNLRNYGAYFLKSDEVLNLPEQNFITVNVPTIKEYKKFMKDRMVTIDNVELVGDNSLNKLLYARQLCGSYNSNKLEAFKDLIDSSEDRWIVFYNFNAELEVLKNIVKDRLISTVNGSIKDLRAYETKDNSITFIQYQAGAMGLNLQKANKIIYFTLPLSCENYMQSLKRIHRINQTKACFYYFLMCDGSVETKILNTLKKGEDYTNNLFEKEF